MQDPSYHLIHFYYYLMIVKQTLKKQTLIKISFVSRYNLKIMGLMSSDSGLFQCVASNAAGNVQTSAYLKVIDVGKSFLNSNRTALKKF